MKRIFHNLIAWKLRILAKWLLRKNHPLVIGITGSIAKTSTKEAIYRVLSLRFESKVRKNEGNLNTDIGLPLAVLGFNKPPKFYQWPYVLILSFFRVLIPKLNSLSQTSILILEYAADKPGDIKYLTSIVKPNIAVMTAIGPAHMINYQSIGELAGEKAQLVYSLKKHDLAILNKKDPRTAEIAKKAKCEIKYFNADLSNIPQQIARKIGEIFEINQKLVEKSLSQIKPLDHRMNISDHQGMVLIDDTYNANPLSMQFALERLSQLAKDKKSQRKVVVFGDMLELGNNSDQYHQKIGELARKHADILIGIGELSKFMKPDQWFKNIEEAQAYLLKNIQKGDIILFKASRKMQLDKLVEKIISIKPH